MLIKDKNGSIKELSSITPIVEWRGRFNGTSRKLIEPAGNIKDANGIVFELREQQGMGCFSQKILVGNLKNAKVTELLDSAVNKGVVDISVIDFQVKKSPQQFGFKFDKGVSSPYYLQTFTPFENSMNNNNGGGLFQSGDIFADPCLGIEEDDGFDEEWTDTETVDMSDDEIRRELYDKGCYSFKDLARMERDALEIEYNKIVL
jgi:hypothetical protein